MPIGHFIKKPSRFSSVELFRSFFPILQQLLCKFQIQFQQTELQVSESQEQTKKSKVQNVSTKQQKAE